MLERWRVLAVAGLCSGAPQQVYAQSVVEPSHVSESPAESTLPLQWEQSDRSAGWLDAAFIGVTGGIALAGLFIEPDREDPWRATLGVDEAVRDGLRLTDRRDRRVARTTSDVLAGVVVSYPLVVETGMNVMWAKSSPRVGLEIGAMQLEVLGLTAALVNTSKWVFGRERPYGRLCGTELSASSEDCVDSDRYVSYFSGHSAFTFASASAVCVQHVRWGLWGDVPSWIPCSTGYALAATTALLRVGADRHYVSDIVTGAAVGTAVGLLVPWFHYRSKPKSEHAGELRWNVAVFGTGVNVSTRF